MLARLVSNSRPPLGDPPALASQTAEITGVSHHEADNYTLLWVNIVLFLDLFEADIREMFYFHRVKWLPFKRV